MAKSDQITLLTNEDLEELKRLIKLNPAQASDRMAGLIRRAANKSQNEFTATEVIREVEKFYKVPHHQIADTSKGFKYLHAEVRRMLALLLSHCTALDRKTITKLCGYAHHASIPRSVDEAMSDINLYEDKATAYKTILTNLATLKNQA